MSSLIRLLQLDAARIEASRRRPLRVDGMPVVDGGLPPTSILDGALKAIRAGKPALWYGPFLFVDIAHRRIVGSAIFKGEPDEGWVEIGYGVADRCRGLGYATAAVGELVRFAFAQSDVLAVYAETSIANPASQRVVQKAGFAWSGERLSDDDGMVDCWVVER